jgi:WD40 repeat protein
MDIDTIEPGVDFVEVIEETVGSADVVLALIGPRWLGAADAHGTPRLEKPDDLVRLEIEAALRPGVRVIPVLVAGAEMPGSDALPPSLAALSRRNAVEVRDTSWRSDVGRLIEALERIGGQNSDAGVIERERKPPTAVGSDVEPSGHDPLGASRTVVRTPIERRPPAAGVGQPASSANLAALELDEARLSVRPFARVIRHDKKVWGVAFSPDGSRIATTSGSKAARVFEFPSGREVVGVRHDDGSLAFGRLALAFGPDGNCIATTGSKTARVWELPSGRELARISSDGGERYGVLVDVAFSSEGDRIATAHNDRIARVWELPSGRELARMSHGGWVRSVAFSPDGNRIATASNDKTARVWELPSGGELAQFTHDSAVLDVAFSPDGNRVATASDDKTARVWELPSGRELARMSHDGWVMSVAFSPDGNRVATASWDKTARVWELANVRELARFSHRGRVRAVTFSPDGGRIATACGDKTAQVWELSEIAQP